MMPWQRDIIMPNSNEKTARNREIYEARERGAQVVELASQYGLSLPRIHRIVMAEENKELKLENARLAADLSICRSKK